MPTFDDFKNTITNPLRTYLWEVMFSTPKGGGNADILNVRCQSSAIPGRSIGNIAIPYKGSAGIGVPGKVKFTQQITLAFLENADKKVFDAVYGWMQYIHDVQNGVGAPDSDCKTDMYLKLITQANETALRLRLVGIYPMDQAETPLTYDEESIIKFTTTFHYDYWYEA